MRWDCGKNPLLSSVYLTGSHRIFPSQQGIMLNFVPDIHDLLSPILLDFEAEYLVNHWHFAILYINERGCFVLMRLIWSSNKYGSSRKQLGQFGSRGPYQKSFGIFTNFEPSCLVNKWYFAVPSTKVWLVFVLMRLI